MRYQILADLHADVRGDYLCCDWAALYVRQRRLHKLLRRLGFGMRLPTCGYDHGNGGHTDRDVRIRAT